MDDPERLHDELDRLDALLRSIAPSSRANNAQITVSMGGIGVWIAATACALALTASILTAVFAVYVFSNQSSQLQELRQQDHTFQAYINAGYVTPQEQEPDQ